MEKYNKSDPKSIEKYAKKLVGKTFNDVINEDDEKIFVALWNRHIYCIFYYN